MLHAFPLAWSVAHIRSQAVVTASQMIAGAFARRQHSWRPFWNPEIMDLDGALDSERVE
jgi:hypothetical protein